MNGPIDLTAYREDRDDDRLATAIAKRIDGLPLTDDERRILSDWDGQAGGTPGGWWPGSW